MSSSLESRSGIPAIERPDVVSQVREALANRLDDMATDPNTNQSHVPLESGDAIRNGERIPATRRMNAAVHMTLQDFRISPEEFGAFESLFLETT